MAGSAAADRRPPPRCASPGAGPCTGYLPPSWPGSAIDRPLPCSETAVRIVLVPVEPGWAFAWCAGQVGDAQLVLEAPRHVPCPAVLMIGKVDGHGAAMRALVRQVGDLAGQVRIVGFIARTAAYGPARAFERLGGVATWSETDGRQRWWIPAEPFFAWLRASAGSGRTRPATKRPGL